ncbi:CsgE family curli-type amyloid fiber assembly protein [Hymenobacter daecheongensis]|nr:CsgE family curli-type amyloid fiber assembly protein [Hymenobacter daecheongensis]
MASSTKNNAARPVRPVPAPVLVLWWRPWMMGLGCLLLLLLAAAPGRAQQAGRKPTSAKEAAPKPEKESEASPLPAKKLEEALQLLIKATRDTTQNGQRRRFRPTEIEGLVMDQTITKVGHDFYDVFYSQWEAPPGVGDFTIIIREKPARGTSTLISVEVNENELLELPLQPKAEIIEETATYAIGVATDFLASSRNVGQQLERGGNQGGIGSF